MTSFKLKIVPKGIFCYYLANLALEDRKFWVRKEYNKSFLAHTGPLSQKEKQALQRFSKLILKLENRIPSFSLLNFFFDRNGEDKLKKLLLKKECGGLESVFNLFRERFAQFWKHTLVKESKNIEKTLTVNLRTQRRLVQHSLKRFSLLYNHPSLPRSVNVFLIPLPAEVISGGGKYMVALGGIVLETSLERAGKMRTIEIILHETIHLWFEEGYFNNLLQEFEEETSQKTKETLFGPLGIPSMYFGIKEILATALTIQSTKRAEKTQPSYIQLLYSASKTLQPIFRMYERRKKSVDKVLFKIVIRAWQSFLKKKKVAILG